MNIEVASADPEILADALAIIEALTSGSPPDPMVIRRVRARSEVICERILREHGLLDIAVPAIREFRDR
ncbi:MAG TPA: hypothetical protein VJ783_31095 [Pirellulales bacterium]|nr:hypothetical protein [Pirellulales bacterium]